MRRLNHFTLVFLVQYGAYFQFRDSVPTGPKAGFKVIGVQVKVRYQEEGDQPYGQGDSFAASLFPNPDITGFGMEASPFKATIQGSNPDRSIAT